MGAEDFAFMLESRPGAYILIGNGDSAFCHTPEFDFTDASIPYGVSYWVTIAENTLRP
jgi:hippurate hydrolase